MEKSRSSPLSFLFPWLSPRVIKFALANNGIEVQLWRNNRLFSNWNPSQLRHVLPEPLSKWINDNHIYDGPQPYPLIKQLWYDLLPIASKKLVIDSSVLAELEEVSQPQDFALIWAINHSSVCIEGRYEGADHYLGMGWFHKGTKIWQLNKQPAHAIDLLLQKPILPLEKTDFLLNLIPSYLQEYVSTHTEFQLVTNFAMQVIVCDARSGGLILALECNYPQFLSTIQVPQQKIDVLLAHQAIIRFPRQALTPVLMHLLQNGGSPVIIQGADVPLFISEQLPTMRHFSHISDDMATKIIQSNPAVSISALQPTFTAVHNYKNGIGLYNINAIYKYLKYEINMKTILAAYRQNQRFIQQYGVWFEWPYNAHGLANTIQQNITIQLLRSEEVMKFDIRRIGDLKEPGLL